MDRQSLKKEFQNLEEELSEMVKFELIAVVIIVKNSLYSILQITVIILVVNACSRTM